MPDQIGLRIPENPTHVFRVAQERLRPSVRLLCAAHLRLSAGTAEWVNLPSSWPGRRVTAAAVGREGLARRDVDGRGVGMSGIAGIAARGRHGLVEQMLQKQSHRGPAGRALLERHGVTLGVNWTRSQARAAAHLEQRGTAADESSNSRFARATVRDGRLTLERDRLGVAPLYFGTTDDGHLCFASEVKALLGVTAWVREFPPGHRCVDGRCDPRQALVPLTPLAEPPHTLARRLRGRLQLSVRRRVSGDAIGSWLSGGLDSSTLAALARPLVNHLHTIAVGLPGAPDLEYARAVADHLGTDHHEIAVTRDDLLRVLDEVIYYLESFDALLVRSSMVNYLASRGAAEYVETVLSGEAGDELFAGYDYLRGVSPRDLPGELIDITGRLHNTALQRVDRSAAAHGLVALVPFADPDVVDLALRIPVEYKLKDGVEKWILRRAMDGALPESVLGRKKAKFWQGAGVEDLLASHAEETISDHDLRQERRLENGWSLSSKEELLYFRVFRQHFSDLGDLSWMGRTKGPPVAA